ncbi:MAG: type II toxin-antitoxin system VapC family toxin [Candidatus Limnocylindria bacterium]
MRLLLDTHAALWALANDPALSAEARSAVVAGENPVFVSAASAWEIGIKRALGRLVAPEDLRRALAAARFEPLAITVEHALAAAVLPGHHGDPFDRMLVAQAQAEELTIVTRDRAFAPYDVRVLRA